MKILSTISWRELRILGRSRGIYLLRGLLPLVFIAWLIWLTRDNYVQQRSFDDLPALGRLYTERFLLGVCLAVNLIVPLLTASIFSRDLQAQTLPLLLISHLRPMDIVVDKLWVRLLCLVLLLATVAPLVLVFMRFGGVGSDELLTMCLIVTINFLWSGGIGLFCAAWIRSLPAALLTAYSVSLLGRIAAAFGSSFRHDLSALVALGWHREALGWHGKPLAWLVGISALVFLGGLLMAIGRVSALARGQRWQPVKRTSQWLDRYFEGPENGHVRLSERTALGNRSPILWRQLHGHYYSSTSFSFRLVVGSAAVGLLLGTAATAFPQADTRTMAMIVLLKVLLLVGALVMGVSSFSQERSERRFDVLLGTPTPTWQFVIGHWLGVLKPVLLASVGLIVMIAIHRFMDGKLAGGWYLASFYAYLLLTLNIGLVGGFLIHHNLRALLASLALAVVLYGAFQRTLSGGLQVAVSLIVAALLLLWLQLAFDRLSGRAG